MSVELLLLPMLAVVGLLILVLVVVPRRRKLVAVNELQFPGLARLRATNSAARVAAVGVGLIVVVTLVIFMDLGLGVFQSPFAFSGIQILAILMAGLVSRDAARTPGVSGLEIRRVRPYLPVGLTRLVGSVFVVLVAALVWTTAVGSPDTLGNAGRNFTYLYPCRYEKCGTSFGPWPGSFYSIPVMILLAVVLVVAVTAVVVTVRRPRNASDPEIVRVDEVVRARAVESIIASLGLASAVTLFAVSFLVANGLGNPLNDVPASLRIPGWFAVTLAFGSLAVAIWCTVVLLLPGGTRFVHESTVSDNTTPVTT